MGLAISAVGFAFPFSLRKGGADWYDWVVVVSAGIPLLDLFSGISGVIVGMSYGLNTGFAMTRLLENRLALPSRKTTETGARPSLANLGGVNIPSTNTMLGELPLTSWLHLGGAASTLGLIGAIFVESTVSDPTPADFALWVLFFFSLFLIPISLGVFLRRYNRFASYLRAIAISFVLSLLGAGVIALLTGSSERLGAFVTSFGFFAAIAATLLGCAILMRAHPQFRLWLGISVVGTGILGLLIRLLGGDLITTIVLGIAIGAVWAILAAIGILRRTYGKFGTWLKYVGVGFIASLVVSSLSFFSPYMGGSGFIVFALSFTIAAAIFSGLVLIPWQNAPEAPVPVIATAVSTSSPETGSPVTPAPVAVDNPVKRVFPSE